MLSYLIVLGIIAIITTVYINSKNTSAKAKRDEINNDIINNKNIDEIIQKYNIDNIVRAYKFITIESTDIIAKEFKTSFATINQRFIINDIHIENNNLLFNANFSQPVLTKYSLDDNVILINVVVIAKIDTGIRQCIDFYAVPIKSGLEYSNIYKEFISAIIVFMQTQTLVNKTA
jgi:hypothetical protein